MFRAVPSGAAGGYTVRRIEHHPDTCPREQPRSIDAKPCARAVGPRRRRRHVQTTRAVAAARCACFRSLPRLRSKCSNSRRHADHARVCKEALRLEPHRDVADCPSLREEIGFSLVGITTAHQPRARPRFFESRFARVGCMRLLAGLLRASRHLLSDARLSPDGSPCRRPSMEMSSSRSGQ